MEKFHLATSITRDHKYLCQCKSILPPYYRGNCSPSHTKSVVSEMTNYVWLHKVHTPCPITTVFIIKGKNLKLLVQVSFITNSPPYTSSLILIMHTRSWVDQWIFVPGSIAALQARMEHLLLVFSI